MPPMNSGTPLVSVIIPSYNRADWLRAAIDSVLAQDYPHYQLIVVDDGSQDETPALLRSYGNRLTLIRQSNQGVSVARNAGISRAEGELIAFLDSDDRWLPGKLAVQVAYMQAHPELLFCQTEEIWMRRGVRVNPKQKHRKQAGMIFEPSLWLCLISPSAVMMRPDFFRKVGRFDESLPVCEDYDLWLRACSCYPVGLVPEPLIVKQGGHADQLSAGPGLDRYRITAIRNILESGRLSPPQQAEAIAVLREKCRIYAAGCQKRGKRDEAAYYHELARRFQHAAREYG